LPAVVLHPGCARAVRASAPPHRCAAPSMQSPGCALSSPPDTDAFHGLVGARVAVHWDDGKSSAALYPAIVRNYHARSQMVSLDYINGDTEQCKLREAAWLRLPSLDRVPCIYCAHLVDLCLPRTSNAAYMVCCACASVMHIRCMDDHALRIELPLDLVSSTKWMCSACLVMRGFRTLCDKPLLPIVDARGTTVLVSNASPQFIDDALTFVPGATVSPAGDLRLPPTSLQVLTALRLRHARNVQNLRRLPAPSSLITHEVPGHAPLSELGADGLMLPSNGLLELGSPQCTRSRRQFLQPFTVPSFSPHCGEDQDTIRLLRRKRTRSTSPCEGATTAAVQNAGAAASLARSYQSFCHTEIDGQEKVAEGAHGEQRAVGRHTIDEHAHLPVPSAPQNVSPTYPAINPQNPYSTTNDKSSRGPKRQRTQTTDSDSCPPGFGTYRLRESPYNPATDQPKRTRTASFTICKQYFIRG
jgi:hypothetical protein